MTQNMETQNNVTPRHFSDHSKRNLRYQYILNWKVFSLYFIDRALLVLKYGKNCTNNVPKNREKGISAYFSLAELAKVTGSLHLHTF